MAARTALSDGSDDKTVPVVRLQAVDAARVSDDSNGSNGSILLESLKGRYRIGADRQPAAYLLLTRSLEVRRELH